MTKPQGFPGTPSKAPLDYLHASEPHPQASGAQGRRSLIRELCTRWIAAAHAPAGAESERFRLRCNGIVFPSLTFEELQEATLGLMRELLAPRVDPVIDADHLLLWSWQGEFLLSRETGYLLRREQTGLRRLLETCLRCALAGTRPPSLSAFEAEELSERELLIEFNLRELGYRTREALAHLSFPLLEGVTRHAAPTFFGLDGQVVQRFSVAGRTYCVGEMCSSIGHAMHVLHRRAASPALAAALEAARAQLQLVDPRRDPFALIEYWRHASLRGDTSLVSIAGTVLSLALLVAMSSYQERYEQLKARVIANCESRELARAHCGRSPWEFYPPW